jgi:outer membrane protein
VLPRNSMCAAAFVFLSLFATPATRAQNSAPSAKIGILNIQQAIATTAEGKQAAAELETQFAPRQQELDSLNKQVNDIRQRLNSGVSLADDERQRLNLQGTRLSQLLERKSNELQEDVNAAQGERVNEIGRKMLPLINKYAADGGFTAILDSSSQNSPVLFAAKNVDVTQDIVRLYDQANPVKSAAAVPAAKPTSAAKPQ